MSINNQDSICSCKGNPYFCTKILRLKKRIPYILCLVFFNITALLATAQSWNRDFNFHLAYPQLSPGGEMASAFDLLAYNNDISVLSLHLDLSYKVQLLLTKPESGIPILYYNVRLQSVGGSTNFRDFKVDSLLEPQKIEAEIKVYQNHQLKDSLVQTILVNRDQILLPVSGRVPLSSLYITFRIRKVIYTEENYRRLVRTAGEINHYYGYFEIMKELPRFLLKTSVSKTPPAHFFLNYLLLSRLKYYVRQHNLSQQLHLDQHDPLNFEKAFKKMSRKQLRMKTLSQQQLSKKGAMSLADKENFTHGYVALSIKAVSLSKEHQPYIAASFNEFARVFPGDKEAAFVQRAEAYYRQGHSPGQESASQEIYQYFIDAASLKIREQSFVRALDFLTNAAYFEDHFPEVKRLGKFDSCLLRARDGLASSYLKVALMASENNDIPLANRYRKKASQSLKAYATKINLSKKPLCYSLYSQEIFRMAENSLQQGHFHNALSLLDTAQRACYKLEGIDSLRTTICKELLKHRLDTARELLEQGNITASRTNLLQLATDYPELCPSKAKFTQNRDVMETATAIFQQTITAGAQLHAQNLNTQAMDCLTSAAKFQKAFSLPGSPQLDSLITVTTIPYVISIADKANLEIWKKHFQKADSIFKTARNLSLRYGVAENNEVKNTLNALSAKIKIADCQWKQERISTLFSKINRAVEAYELTAAKSYFLRARKLYARRGSCQRDNKQTADTLRVYENLFHYTDAYHTLTLQLFNKGFAAVLPEFARLEEQYHAEHLEKFKLPYSGLYAFVQSQHSDKLTMEAVHYFIQNKEFAKALRYLQLSKNAADAKTEQKQIALGFVAQNMTPQYRLLTQPAWVHFAKAYRKALSSKTK